nr:sulfite exporter TauE/SafE family protein [Candidatus Njordarchaeum guaymaensis]
MIDLTNGVIIAVSAFLMEVVDASIGMGYGTVLTPVLLMVGFDPTHVVPAVIISQLAGDFAAAGFHHSFENVTFTVSGKSEDLRIALTLGVLSAVGAVIAVFASMRMSKLYLSLYIGFLVAAIGVVVLTLAIRKKSFGFSWPRLFGLGLFASFNKGISGGGYGPIIASGQIISGVGVKSAIGITSLAEGIVCITAFMAYLLTTGIPNWPLALYLTVGVFFSAPVAAYIVRKVEAEKLKLIMGVVTTVLGVGTIFRLISP